MSANALVLDTTVNKGVSAGAQRIGACVSDPHLEYMQIVYFHIVELSARVCETDL